MRLGLLTAFVGVTMIVAAGRVQGTVYHVTAGGSDAASGSSTFPWRTVAKANSAAVAGDVVIVHGGQYSDGIRPSNSGTAGNPITFQAAPGEHVVLNTDLGIGLGSSSQYITVDGFEIQASYRVVEIVGSSYITIRNCTMFGGRGMYSGFSLDGASYCVIQNNYYNRQDPDGATQYGDNPTGGDGLRLVGNSNHNLIEGNTVTRCEHVAFASSFSTSTVYQCYNVWRYNRSYDNHTNYSLQDGVQRCVFEGNLSYYPGLVWTGGNGNGFQFTGGKYCIIRFNTVYDDTGTIYTDRRWPALLGIGVCASNDASMQYNKFYNNTVYGETDQKEWNKAGFRIDNNSSTIAYQNNNVFKNNIIADTRDVQILEVDGMRSLDVMNNRYEGNLLMGAGGAPATVRYEYSGGNDTWTLPQVKNAMPGQWAASNKEGDPLFVNTVGQGPAKDFSLRPGSPAVDAGVAMTSASSSGSGTTLVVADAGYFMDGWGVPGVEGDSIKIDGGAPVGLTGVDYSTNTLTLNSSRTWNAGSSIYYYRSDRFRGNAPDIGSHEYGAGAPAAMPPMPPGLLSPADGGTAPASSTTFAWTGTTGTTTFRLQISSNAMMTQLVVDQSGLTGPNSTVSSLQSGSLYYWRVSASNSVGTSSWSAIRSFTAGADPTLGKNILNNSDFTSGTSAWTFYTDGVGSMQQASPGYDDNLAANITIGQGGSNMQMYQYNVVLEAGASYRLSFAAYSSTGHSMDVVLQQHGAPYTNYGLEQHVALSTSWAPYSVDFKSATPTAVSDGRLMFWFGGSAQSGDQYWLDHIVLEKTASASAVPTEERPAAYALEQNYPNPFNPVTTIRYSIGGNGAWGVGNGAEAGAGGQGPGARKTMLAVYDVLGRQVATLVNEEKAPGSYEVRFDGSGLSSGVYIYRLTTGSYTDTKRMVLLK